MNYLDLSPSDKIKDKIERGESPIGLFCYL